MGFTSDHCYRRSVGFFTEAAILEGRPQICQVYLRYQDLQRHSITFEINDSALTENGFTCYDVSEDTVTSTRPTLRIKVYLARKFSENMPTVTSTTSIRIKVYSHS